MRVTVLYGGPSAEREVSLVSGKAVIDGLKSMGHEVFASDVSPTDLSGLDHATDVIFPVLHGQFGESGELQEILEQRGLPFVGSGSAASKLGMDKVATKKAWQAADLPTPSYRVITAADRPFQDMSDPCVVKAISSGSSIDVYVCKNPKELPQLARLAMENVVTRHGRALVEQFIKGPELTVGLLEEKPLAPIRIVPKREFFDYEAKYKASDTEHRFDTGLSAELVEECHELARKANAVVGARDLARIDIMIHEATQKPYLLEINTLPGFTPKSLLPEAAKHSGIDFGPLVDRLVKRAAARR
jgi:D-alanine-D-alanine ligase